MSRVAVMKGKYVPMVFYLVAILGVARMCFYKQLYNWDMEVARLSTPDGMSCFWIAIAFYFLLERKGISWLVLSLTLAILTRIDTVIMAIVSCQSILFCCCLITQKANSTCLGTRWSLFFGFHSAPQYWSMPRFKMAFLRFM